MNVQRKNTKKRGHRQGGALAFGREGNERLEEEEEKERKKTKWNEMKWNPSVWLGKVLSILINLLGQNKLGRYMVRRYRVRSVTVTGNSDCKCIGHTKLLLEEDFSIPLKPGQLKPWKETVGPEQFQRFQGSTLSFPRIPGWTSQWTAPFS